MSNLAYRTHQSYVERTHDNFSGKLGNLSSLITNLEASQYAFTITWTSESWATIYGIYTAFLNYSLNLSDYFDGLVRILVDPNFSHTIDNVGGPWNFNNLVFVGSDPNNRSLISLDGSGGGFSTNIAFYANQFRAENIHFQIITPATGPILTPPADAGIIISFKNCLIDNLSTTGAALTRIANGNGLTIIILCESSLVSNGAAIFGSTSAQTMTVYNINNSSIGAGTLGGNAGNIYNVYNSSNSVVSASAAPGAQTVNVTSAPLFCS
jgi:hypothetical protein